MSDTCRDEKQSWVRMGVERREACVVHRLVKEGFSDKMTFEQKPE